LPWRRPEIVHTATEFAEKVKKSGGDRVLFVTDAGLTALGLYENLLTALYTANVNSIVYDGTQPNPTLDNIAEAVALYRKHGCAGIVAFGGGSPIDCAKAVGASIARPKKKVSKMRGLLKVLKPLPFLAAVPTTAGTGSETTVAAVVVDGRTHEKYAINDPVLIPRLALHDPALTAGLPPHITAQTGLDALVHAVESYIGHSNTRQTRRDALEATGLIFRNLYTAYTDGKNLEARKNMQTAAFLAGAAFTRAYVGNVHAAAHTLGGQYGTAHGLANAVIMPYVLGAYGKSAHRRLAELAVAAGIADTAAPYDKNAEKLIAAIRELNVKMGIPETLPDLREEDIPLLAGRALREANPLYPVPKIFGREEMEGIFRKILVREGGK
jgi:alcohol dehydrogenase class IV